MQSTFILHAALLRQAFAHCAKFPTAASRRSPDRVSVPVWPITLSGRLPIDRLGGPLPRQLANRPRSPPDAPGLAVPGFALPGRRPRDIMRYCPEFPRGIPHIRAG